MKLNKIDEVNSANSLFKWRFSEIMLPWQRDVTTSPLYTVTDSRIKYFLTTNNIKHLMTGPEGNS